VKVLDFGVAKLAGPDDKELVSKTLAGLVVGTPAYMAPEQVQGLEVGPACDIYALGTVLYEILAERRPFVAPGYLQLAMQISTELPSALPVVTSTGEAIPPALSAVVMRCLSKSPALRFASMKELSDALAPFERHDTNPPEQPQRVSAEFAKDVTASLGGRPPTSEEPLVLPRSNRAPLFISIVSVVALLGLGITALTRHRPEPEPQPVPVPIVQPRVVEAVGADAGPQPPVVAAPPVEQVDDPPPLPPVSPPVAPPAEKRPVRRNTPRKTSTIDPYAN
ncbi:MAG: protein kinase, partial [Myxococcaceae bacterium]|nr:protein kinase [Myxococcaceae bacterium]